MLLGLDRLDVIADGALTVSVAGAGIALGTSVQTKIYTHAQSTPK